MKINYIKIFAGATIIILYSAPISLTLLFVRFYNSLKFNNFENNIPQIR